MTCGDPDVEYRQRRSHNRAAGTRPACRLAGRTGREAQRETEEMVEGRSDAAGAARSGTAWSAAGRGPSSAPCIASRRGWTTSTSWSPARCRPTRSGRSPRRRSSASRPTAPTPPTRRWRRPKAKRPDGIEAVSIVTPEQQPRADRQGLPQGRHQRHLRQAAVGDGQGSEGPGRADEEDRADLRRHPQLHRLPDAPAGPRDGRRRASSATSASCRPSTPRTG